MAPLRPCLSSGRFRRSAWCTLRAAGVPRPPSACFCWKKNQRVGVLVCRRGNCGIYLIFNTLFLGDLFNFRDEGAMHQITQITQTLCQASGKTEPCRQPSRLPGLGRSGGHRRAARTVVGVVLPFIKGGNLRVAKQNNNFLIKSCSRRDYGNQRA